MTFADDTTRPRGHSDEELLRRVHDRAAHLRFRRRGGALAVAAVMVAVMGLAGLTRIAEDEDRLVRTAGGPFMSGIPAPASTTAETRSPEPTVITTPPGPSSTITSSPPPMAAPSTTTQACHNSHDPACGPFYFDPPPDPDQPMTVEVTASATTVRVGEPMSFHVVRRDPDGVSGERLAQSFGDVMSHRDYTVPDCDRFGKWDPPPKDRSVTEVTEEIPHTYLDAGVFTPTFSYGPPPPACVDSRTGRGENPYASRADGSMQIIVLP